MIQRKGLLLRSLQRDQDHLRELLTVCDAQRQIGETSLNEISSRSHQILRLTIESCAREFLGKNSSSTLAACVNFADLAGSERASQALSAGVRLKEGIYEALELRDEGSHYLGKDVLKRASMERRLKSFVAFNSQGLLIIWWEKNPFVALVFVAYRLSVLSVWCKKNWQTGLSRLPMCHRQVRMAIMATYSFLTYSLCSLNFPLSLCTIDEYGRPSRVLKFFSTEDEAYE